MRIPVGKPLTTDRAFGRQAGPTRRLATGGREDGYFALGSAAGFADANPDHENAWKADPDNHWLTGLFLGRLVSPGMTERREGAVAWGPAWFTMAFRRHVPLSNGAVLIGSILVLAGAPFLIAAGMWVLGKSPVALGLGTAQLALLAFFLALCAILVLGNREAANRRRAHRQERMPDLAPKTAPSKPDSWQH
jgi:hypothetical protein